MMLDTAKKRKAQDLNTLCLSFLNEIIYWSWYATTWFFQNVGT